MFHRSQLCIYEFRKIPALFGKFNFPVGKAEAVHHLIYFKGFLRELLCSCCYGEIDENEINGRATVSTEYLYACVVCGMT